MMPLTLTDAAIKAIKEQLVKRGTPQARLRVGIKSGGCSGFSYVIQYEDEPPRERDVVLAVDGIEVLVDPKSAVLLKGSTLDYKRTLIKSGFTFENPNEASGCGCGNSFSVK